MVKLPLFVARLAMLVKTELAPSRVMLALLVVRLTPLLSVRVELVKTSQVPAASVLVPVLTWVTLVMLSVPDRASTVPRLLTAKVLKVRPAPPDLRKVPVAKLLKVGAGSATFTKLASACTSNRPALLITAALPPRQKKLAPAPVRVAPPLIFRVRPVNSVKLLAVMARLPLVVVWPLPLMVPPVQVVAPLIVTGPAPLRVPL